MLNENLHMYIKILKETNKNHLETTQNLQKENGKLHQQIADMEKAQESFLIKAQLKNMKLTKKERKWPNEAIIKGLKLHFALSVSGYKYLLSTGYPSPSYETLMRRIRYFKLEFDIFQDVLNLLKFKVESMEGRDKYCILSYDEMQINKKDDYNPSTGEHVGYVTLDPM